MPIKRVSRRSSSLSLEVHHVNHTTHNDNNSHDDVDARQNRRSDTTNDNVHELDGIVDPNCSSNNVDRTTMVKRKLQDLHRQEQSPVYQCHDYIAKNATWLWTNDATTTTTTTTMTHRCCTRINPIDDVCRHTMCAWCYNIVDFCSYPRETVALAFGYVDRYLSSSSTSARATLGDRLQYQLVIMTALYIAINETETIPLSMEDLVQQSRGSYCTSDVEEMEHKLLETLQWKLHQPTPLSFVRCYLSLMSSSSVDATRIGKIFHSVQHQLECSVVDYHVSVNQLPSDRALSAIVNNKRVHRLLSPQELQDFCHAVEDAGRGCSSSDSDSDSDSPA